MIENQKKIIDELNIKIDKQDKMIKKQSKKNEDLYKQIEEVIKNKIEENNQVKEKSKGESIEKNKKKEVIDTVNKKFERKNIEIKEKPEINIKKVSKILIGCKEKPNEKLYEQKREIIDKQQINKKVLLNGHLEKGVEIIKFTDDYMKTRLEKGIKNILLFSLGCHITIGASAPYIIHNAFINICALSLGTNVLINEIKYLKEEKLSKLEKRKNQKKNENQEQIKKKEKFDIYEDDLDLYDFFYK